MHLISRRDFLRQTGFGLSSIALTTLLADDSRLVAGGGKIDASKLKGPAKNVILLFMGGGPSQVDTWDPKPELAKLQGKKVPDSVAKLVPRIARSRLDNL